MFFVRPPLLLRLAFSSLCWRIPENEKTVYLTFDDGPIPEMTPKVLELLDSNEIKATFFCVGENVLKYPELHAETIKRKHAVGNHTYNHLKLFKTNTKVYLENINKASEVINSTLFRPPHGQMTKRIERKLNGRYSIIMWDIISGDYKSEFTVQQIIDNVVNNVRNGSIIVFHDSLKAGSKMLNALPIIINILKNKGFEFKRIGD